MSVKIFLATTVHNTKMSFEFQMPALTNDAAINQSKCSPPMRNVVAILTNNVDFRQSGCAYARPNAVLPDFMTVKFLRASTNRTSCPVLCDQFVTQLIPSSFSQSHFIRTKVYAPQRLRDHFDAQLTNGDRHIGLVNPTRAVRIRITFAAPWPRTLTREDKAARANLATAFLPRADGRSRTRWCGSRIWQSVRRHWYTRVAPWQTAGWSQNRRHCR